MNQDFVVIGPKSARSSSLRPLRHLLVPIALAELGFLSRIGHSKFERLLLVSVTQPWPLQPTRMIFHISQDKYTSLITDSIHCRNCSFSNFADSGSRWTCIGNLKGCLLFGGTEPWPLDPNMWYFTYLKKSYLLSLFIREISKISTYCGFHSLPKNNSIDFCPGVYNAHLRTQVASDATISRNTPRHTSPFKTVTCFVLVHAIAHFDTVGTPGTGRAYLGKNVCECFSSCP